MNIKTLMLLDKYFPPDPRVENEINYLSQNNIIDGNLLCYRSKQSIKVQNSFRLYNLCNYYNYLDIFKNFQHIIPIFPYMWAREVNRFNTYNEELIIHMHDLYMLEIWKFIQNKNNMKLVVDLHENYSESILNYSWATKFPRNIIFQPKQWKNRERRILNYCHGIIVVTKYQKENLLLKYPELEKKKWLIYPNLPNRYMFNQKFRRKDVSKPIKLLYFGKIAKRRGIDTLLEAVEILFKQKRGIELYLIGPIDKSEKNYFNLKISHCSKFGKVSHIPWLDMEHAVEYFYKTDIGVCPLKRNKHHDETIANKIYQHMASGKPIIVSDCSYQASFVNKHKAGLVFESDNINGLVNNIICFIKNPELINTFGVNNLKRINEIYSVNDYSKIFHDFYSDILSN